MHFNRLRVFLLLISHPVVCLDTITDRVKIGLLYILALSYFQASESVLQLLFCIVNFDLLPGDRDIAVAVRTEFLSVNVERVNRNVL